MLKLYKVGKKLFQYTPGEQPAGAEEVIEGKYQPSFQKSTAPAVKVRKTANKARKAETKTQEAVDK